MGLHSLGWKDPLEEDMATQSSILAWRIPVFLAWRIDREEHGRLSPRGLNRVRQLKQFSTIYSWVVVGLSCSLATSY